MFNTKIEVDRHVENCLKKLNSETERNLRCFAFAKLYFKVGDYEQARRYVSMYLNVKPVSAEAQNLLGKALEKLGKRDQALEAYRTSLDLDPKQNSLVIKICELLSSDDVCFDKCGARYYCEKAQSFDPHNPAVFSLKEKLVASDSKDPNDVSQLLLKELETRPTDVDIRIRLLKHLLQHNQVKEAYKHAQEIEQKNLSMFLGNLTWYETVAEVLIRYQRDITLSKNLTWEFWVLLISVLDKVVSLSLDERSINIKNSSEYIVAVFNFDQTLKVASENVGNCPERHLVQEFLNHFRGQLCLHLATLLYKQAKKELIQYKEAALISLPLLFAAYHVQPADLQSLWLDHTTDNRKKQVQRWHREAGYRCSQAGHILLAAAKDRKSIILERASQGSSGMWREQLFKRLFVTRDQQAQIKNSYFTTCPQLVDVTIELPDLQSLAKYNEVAQLIYPDSLHHYIWIGLNQKLSNFNCSVFSGLQYSIKNLNNCAAETLNVLDIQSFLYCSVLCAQSQLEEAKHSYYFNPNKPQVLPAAITDYLGTVNQSKWLTAAYKMYKNEYSSNFSELRLILIRGIEVVRCIGNHGLDVRLLLALANAFSERSKLLTKHSEIELNDARAELYWKAALPLLEKLKNNQAITYAPNRLFEYKSKEMSHSEILHHVDSGKLFNAIQLMKKKEHEKALKLFEQLKDPYASFSQAQIYKSMADEQTNQSKENLTSEMRSQNIILLSRARDYLYLTLDRLRDPAVDKQHPLNIQLGTEIEKVERLLSRIDPDISINRNECDGMSDENTSSMGSIPDHIGASFSMQNQSYMNGVSPRQDIHSMHTPYRLEPSFRREARPSPERLDAQLRQLAASKDAAINNILEQNKIMVDSHRNLVEELRSFKDAVTTLTTTVNDLKTIKHTVDELKGIKQSVDELKVAVDDLQSFRNVSDLVYEMRKEIADMKKDTKIKSNQLSDEDLYVLDDEYGAADFNITSNPVAGLNPSLYPNFQGRLAGANNLAYPAPTLYAGMYPMYPYHSLGLPQPGGLPFADAAQIPDFRVGGFPQPQQPSYPPAALPPAGLSQTAHAAGLLSQTAITQGGLGQALLQNQGLSSQSNIFKDPAPAPVLPSQAGSSIGIHVLPTSTTHHTTVATTSNKAPPLNVVITASDPLPTTKITSVQPILSVTIPPQHLKGNQQKQPQPHNYQIPLPASINSATLTTPAVMNQSPLPVSTQSLLSNIAPPIYSAISDSKTPSKNVGLGIQIEKSLSQSFNNSKNDSKLDVSVGNKSATSTVSVDEHDPCPDFKPIIPLPDEVTVNTGEENETIMFCERAKLYRYTNKEWRERGVGDLKILKNRDTGKIRILMRRDQVHKVCANHFITKDMELKPMQQSDRAFIWAANDFADQEFVLEKLCVKFKTPEEAQKFRITFEKAQKELPDESNAKATGSESKSAGLEIKLKPVATSGSASVTSTPVKVSEKSQPVASLGGFVFTSTPTFKPKDDAAPTAKVTTNIEPTKTSPFATFTFGSKSAGAAVNSPFSTLLTTKPEFKPVEKVNELPPTVITTTPKRDTGADDASAEEFVPTAEFKPVIPLPELVEVKTGEENSIVLFEHKAKLLRFDTTAKEWKERGVGIMKILKEKTIRFVMRREQVHKVCCNHQLLKNMTFTKMEQNTKAVLWCAKDFSEGVLKDEMLTIRFKTEDIADSFLEAVKSAQALLDDNNQVQDKDVPRKEQEKKSDKKSKSEAAPEKVEATSPVATKVGWGDKFKPKAGSWECKNCYIVNDGKVNYCVACDTPKNDAVPKKTTDSDSSGPQFSFGIAKSPAQTNLFGIKQDTSTASSFIFGQKPETKPAATGWGDSFKPKAGSWECKDCYTRNDGDKLYCMSCEAPKDDTVPKKDTNKGVNLDTGGLKFTFGMPSSTTPAVPANTPVVTSTFSFGTSSLSNTTTGFSFGSKPTPTESGDGPLNLTSGKPTFNFKLNMPVEEVKPVVSENKEKFVFGSPQKHTFEFTPRSPRRHSSGPGEDESDGSCVEDEGDTIYFKPVIPLPDKVEVKTGEEQEEVLYCHRAKLFRFVQGEWKERGLGDLKILQMLDTGRLRVLMRREKILKICLNHILTPDIEYLPKDDRTWLFYAPDFSEGEINHEQFCLRFKSAEVAQEFKAAVDKALAGTNGEQKSKKTDSDSDVEFISETKVSKEEEQEALKLMLPPKFMAYRQLSDCTCDQCKKDDEILKNLFDGKSSKPTAPQTSSVSSPAVTRSSVFSSAANTTTSSFFGTPTGQSGTPQSSAASSIFGTPSSVKSDVTKFSFGTPAATDFSFSKVAPESTLKELLSKPSILASMSSSKPEGSPSTIFGSGAGSESTDTKPQSEAAKSFVFALKTESEKTATAPSKDIFGGSASAAPEMKPFSFTTQANTSLFSSPSTNPPPATGSLFGTSSNSSIFGSPAPSSTTGNIFGGSSIFGASKPSTTIFGGTNLATPVFGASATAQTEKSSGTGNPSIFGATANLPNFASLAISKETMPSFGSLAQGDGVQNNNPVPKELDLGLKCDSSLSFASLAATTNQNSPPAFVVKSDDKNPFAHLGAGAPVFGSKSGPSPQKKNNGDAADEECGAGDDYDPHYEPIVPLPEAIVVSTGEEEEEAIFNERSKLFRYDEGNKEWKERGVGQLKLLYHPEKATYRLLLRREQVHKVVLNMLVTTQLELQPMIMSDRAWLWVGYNHAEEEPAVEKLAARFKNSEMTERFYNTVQNAIKALKQMQEEKDKEVTIPATIENYEAGGEDSLEGDYSNVDEEGDCDDCEYDDNDESDERSIMFSKHCQLSEQLPDNSWKVLLEEGDLKVYYDPDFYGACITAADDTGLLISKTIIGMNTTMTINGKECTWRAVEWANDIFQWKYLKATFNSEEEAQEFHLNYEEGLQYAEQCDIIDEIPRGLQETEWRGG